MIPNTHSYLLWVTRYDSAATSWTRVTLLAVALGSNHEGDTETVIEQWMSSAPEILPSMTHTHRRIRNNRTLELSTRHSRRLNEKVYGITACARITKKKRTDYDKRHRSRHHNRATDQRRRRRQPKNVVTHNQYRREVVETSRSFYIYHTAARIIDL